MLIYFVFAKQELVTPLIPKTEKENERQKKKGKDQEKKGIHSRKHYSSTNVL